MSVDSPAVCQENWLDRSGFLKLFRALRLSISPTLLVPAFIGIALTWVVGSALDWVWPVKSSPVLSAGPGWSESELDHYLSTPGDAKAATLKWANEQTDLPDVKRAGAFELLLLHARRSADAVPVAVLALDFWGLLSILMGCVMAVAWVFSMHWFYATLFSIAFVIIWGICGGAVCRGAAIRFGREDSISPRDVLQYSRTRWLNFAMAPIIPAIVLGLLALVLAGLGMLGAIPALGELGVGLLFPIVILLGLIAAVVAIGGLLMFPMLWPGMAADDVDPGDAIAHAGNFIAERPFKYLFFMLTSLAYGAVCLMLLKLFVAIGLWIAASCLGSTMNWGQAYALTDGDAANKVEASKLTAMWQAPRPNDGRPFYGTFDGPKLRHVSDFSARCIKAWIFVLWGVVAAFAVTFFHVSSTIVYFVMRRDVNETDMEDVYLERADAGTPSPVARGT